MFGGKLYYIIVFQTTKTVSVVVFVPCHDPNCHPRYSTRYLCCCIMLPWWLMKQILYKQKYYQKLIAFARHNTVLRYEIIPRRKPNMLLAHYCFLYSQSTGFYTFLQNWGQLTPECLKCKHQIRISKQQDYCLEYTLYNKSCGIWISKLCALVELS